MWNSEHLPLPLVNELLRHNGGKSIDISVEQLEDMNMSYPLINGLLEGGFGRRVAVNRSDRSPFYLKFPKCCGHCHAGFPNNPEIPSTAKKCADCMNIFYCNRECQTLAWPRHKFICDMLKREHEECQNIRRT